MSSPVQKFKFPTAEEITRDWGERCPDVDQDCGCCQMWNTFDLLADKDAEIGAKDRQIRVLEELHKDFKILQRRIIGTTGLSAIETIDDFLMKFDAKYLAELTQPDAKSGASDA